MYWINNDRQKPLRLRTEFTERGENLWDRVPDLREGWEYWIPGRVLNNGRGAGKQEFHKYCDQVQSGTLICVSFTFHLHIYRI